MSLQQPIRKFCSAIGKDPLLVQGAGGNVSWKENDVLWIKASGTWLADAEDNDIFVAVKLDHLTSALKNQDYSIVPQTVESSPLKPSIETLLHALMPQRIVVHVHAIEVLAHLVREDFDLTNYPDLDKTLNARVVEYCKPGAELAEAVANQLNSTSRTNVVFLKNHGVIIGGDTIDEISSTLQYLSAFFCCPTTSAPHRHPESPVRLANGTEFRPMSAAGLHELASAPELIQHLEKTGHCTLTISCFWVRSRIFTKVQNKQRTILMDRNNYLTSFSSGTQVFSQGNLKQSENRSTDLLLRHHQATSLRQQTQSTDQCSDIRTH